MSMDLAAMAHTIAVRMGGKIVKNYEQLRAAYCRKFAHMRLPMMQLWKGYMLPYSQRLRLALAAADSAQ